MVINLQDQSLNKALASSLNLAEEIKKAAKNYCAVDLKNKKCDDITDVGSPEIESKYQVVRKESTFQRNNVTMQTSSSKDRSPSRLKEPMLLALLWTSYRNSESANSSSSTGRVKTRTANRRS